VSGVSEGRPAPTATSGVKWNAIALVGKQGATILATILLARILGPESYGIIAQATLYITLTTLLLDQGLSSALIASKSVSSRQLGAASTVNLGLATVLLLITVAAAGPFGAFMRSPQLPLVLIVLGAGLYFKAAAIVPRVIITRSLNFKALAVAEPASAILGAVVAIIAALIGFSYWSLVLQIMVGDLALLVGMAIAARTPLPNLSLGLLRHTFGFGIRAFGDQLISYFARNADNLMVSRFFGATQLSYYALSYRILLTPIQLIGQVITRVLFPALARVRDDPSRTGPLIQRSIRAVAVVAFPSMLLVSVAAWDVIQVVLGSAWLPAAPVLAILAITGARQSVTSINSPVMLAMNRPDVQLRFSLTAAVVQIGGMVCGLPWGIVGVAAGYTIAGIVLTPLIGLVQRHVTGLTLTQQLSPMAGPFHASLWAVAVYAAIRLIPLAPLGHLVIGGVAGLVVYALVLRFVHRAAWSAVISDANAVIGRRRRAG